jgi:hypothetical protein
VKWPETLYSGEDALSWTSPCAICMQIVGQLRTTKAAAHMGRQLWGGKASRLRHREQVGRVLDVGHHYCNIIEAPWLVNGGHGASLRHH